MAELVPLGCLLDRLDREPARVVACASGVDVTAADFLARIRDWYGAFTASSKQQVVLHCEDSLEFAAALFGAWHAGKQVVLPPDTLPSTLEALAPGLLAGDFPGALAATPAQASVSFDPLDAGATCLVLHTSGSSGDAVAIAKSLQQLQAELQSLEACFGSRMDVGDVQGTVSHQHIYGLLFRVLWPLSSGRIFHSARLGYAEQIAAALSAGPTVLVTSPAMLKRLPESLDWSAAGGALPIVFCSGGPLHGDVARSVSQQWSTPVTEVFGSTETGGIAWREGTTAWRNLPGVDTRVVEGRLQVRSPHLAETGWLVTQDLALEIAEGFELLGRADRLVKLEERRISLSAIERALMAHPAVADARALMLAGGAGAGARARIAVVAVPSAQGSARLAAEGRRALADALRSALRASVDAIALPRRWRFVDSLPADAQGKTSTAVLSRLFDSAEPAPRWVARGKDHARLQVTAEASLAVFDGHFPQSPILPGVALLDWAIRFGKEAFAIDGPFQRADAIKFQRLVSPGTDLELSLEWRLDTGMLSFRFESLQGLHASGRIAFRNGEPS